MTVGLQPDERDTLLRLARAAIDDALTGGTTAEAVIAAARITPRLRDPGGVFVTLKTTRTETGDPCPATLRGCIGRIRSELPIYRGILETAPQSALGDPRFGSLTPAELTRVRIEVSVLTPPIACSGVEAIVLGRDGVELRRGGRHSVFLPQVAPEQGWTVEQLLERLAQKAGLAANGWQQAELSLFQAEVFGE